MLGVYAKRAVLILAVLVLVVEGYFAYRWYDRYYGSGSVPDNASGDVAPLTTPDGEAPEETTAQGNVTSEATDADRDEADARRDEAEYVGAVGEVQSGAVDAFLKSHEKLLRYDALAADDVEEMEANETLLLLLTRRADNLTPPRKYQEQHVVFASAIDNLSNATVLAHGMAADPVAAGSGFDEYDRHVNEASDLLLRSNELLGKDYETIEGVREVSPDF